ncbi:MAG: hypothetical protein WDO68_29945 [Gammaproteobacteria bacterium]
MRSTTFRTIPIAALVTGFGLAGGLASSVALAAAGKVLLVSGIAKVEGAGERKLQKGDDIDVGNIVSTDEGASLQLLMADGARIALQPGSRVRIDAFAMPSSVTEPGRTDAGVSPGKSIATLLRGRIDASAGAIGAITFHTHGDPVTLIRARSAFVSLDSAGELIAPPVLEDAARPPELSMEARSRLGLGVNLLEAHLPLLPQVSAAVAVPLIDQPAFAASTTERSDTFAFNGGGSVLQFNSLLGSGVAAEDATYLSGTAALLDFGRNGSSGIRWGRWSTGTASITTRDGKQSVNLQDASLHWIAGPVFEARPVLPTTGSINFTLAGGTSPTDTLGHAGALNAAVFSADFTSQKVNAQLSLDVNGYNWFATGSGSITTGTARFGGAFGTVLVDGRVGGSGAFSGFLSAGPLTPDQINGAGLSYWLVANQGSLGTVSGVAAFVPGPMVPLAPPLVERDVAYVAGGLSLSDLAGGVAANSRTEFAVNSNGDLIRFRAPVPGAPLGTFGIGIASNADTGSDAATGIRWGRWDGGAIDVTVPPASSHSHEMSEQSLHWIAGNEFGAPPTLPQTGTATYTLIGNTDPTDTSGHTGLLGTASFTADFTNRFVDSKLTLNINDRAWYASGQATFPIGGQRFVGTYDDVRIDNLARGQGTIDGFFTQPRIGSGSADGAGLAFNLADNAGQLGVVSGVMAFVKGGPGASVSPADATERDIATISPDFVTGGTYVSRASPASYELDNDFGLASLPGIANTVAADTARYAIGGSAKAESDVSPLVMLRWGRWSGGTATVTNLSDNSTYSLDLSQRSLHWIEGADTAAPPVMPQFGFATYALMGATSPTDRSGHSGVLNNASLTADFTHQAVGVSLDMTISNVSLIANGVGLIGASAGLPAHQFSGAITSGAISGTGNTPQGSFSGFFSAPGGTRSGVPGGAGLTYTVTDGHGGLTVDGAAAFRGP